jgi:Tfp pilus assembly protein FimT
MVSVAQRDMSLSKLMVTFAIMLAMAMLAVPLTSCWVKNTHLSHAKNILVEGYTSARALALQNTANTTGRGTAASLAIANTTLSVSYPGTVPGTIVSVWSGTVSADTTITLNDSCGGGAILNLKNTGMPSAGSCLAYRIAVSGGDSETGTLQ